jgi:hypothetical protein
MEYTFFQNHSNLNVAEIGRISVILSGPASTLVIVMTEHVTEGFLVLSHRFFPSGGCCNTIIPDGRRRCSHKATHRLHDHWSAGRLRHDSPGPTALRYSVVKDRYCKSAAPGGLTIGPGHQLLQLRSPGIIPVSGLSDPKLASCRNSLRSPRTEVRGLKLVLHFQSG